MNDSTQSERVGEHRDPPAPFRRTASGVLKVTRGGGVISLLGAPFFLAGIFMLLSAAGTVPMRTASGEMPIIVAPMGFVFLAVGGIMVFGRQWLVLDFGRRSILRQIGLVVPFRTEERLLSEFRAVIISHHPGDSESAETFPVTLRASIGKDAVLVKPLRFAESLAAAEYLAQLLSLQLIDATIDRETIISPERNGEALHARLSKAMAGTQPASRPASMRSDITERTGETRIVLPGGGPTIAGYAGLFLPIAVLLIAMLVAIPVLVRSTKPLALFCMLMLLFGVPTVVASVRFMISSKRKGTTVTASRSGLMIEQPGNGKTQPTMIAAMDVLEVDYMTFESAIASVWRSANPAMAQSSGNERAWTTLRRLVPNPGIVIKSRSGPITIGEGLSTEELQYLVGLIRKALIG